MPSQATHRAGIREEATRRIEIGRTSTGPIYYGPGTLLLVPAVVALRRLAVLHERAVGRHTHSRHIRRLPVWGARILHRRETAGCLGTLISLEPQRLVSVIDEIFSFVENRKSVEGVEALMFSAVLAASHGHPHREQRGRSLLHIAGPPRIMGGGYAQTPVVDPVAGQLAFLTPAQVSEFGGNSVGGAVPGTGPSLPGGFEWLGNIADDANSCTKTVIGISAALGGLAGIGIGGLTGTAAAPKDGSGTVTITIGVGSGLVAGLLGGAQGGQSLATALCPGNSPTTPASSGTDSKAEATDVETDAPSAQDQADADNGFAAGWAAATGSQYTGPAGTSQAFSDGYADGYNAAQAMHPDSKDGGKGEGVDVGNPQGGDDTGTPEGGVPEGGNPDGSTGGNPDGGGDPAPSGGNPTGMEDPDGGGDEGSATGAVGVVHHATPSGPGLSGLTSAGSGGPLSASGAKIIALAHSLPDPDNNPHALASLARSTRAQAALLADLVATQLGAR